MTDPVQVLWTPAGVNLSALGTKLLIDITDGDTPNIRMPVRMLSIDTPEVTARTEAGAERMDAKLAQLAEWLAQRSDLPVSRRFAEYLISKLAGQAGSLQFRQGTAASEFAKDNAAQRLTRSDGSQRSLFVRVAEAPFDPNGRLLAYLAPNYSAAERNQMTREQQANSIYPCSWRLRPRPPT